LPFAVATLVGVVAGGAGACARRPQTESGAARRALARELGPGSLAGGRFVGLPAPPTADPPAAHRLRAAARRLERALETRADPALLADLGVVYLAAGRADAALAALAEAVELAPSAENLSDLAAARLAAPEPERARALVAALDASERALALRPELPAAAFNRALALEALGLDRLARRAWRAWLPREPEPDWRRVGEARLESSVRAATELRRQRHRLAQAVDEEATDLGSLVAAAPQRARREGEERLERWAAAVAAGRREEAARSLDAAARLGEALTAGGGDVLLSEAAAAIRAVERGGDASLLSELADAHLRLARGRDLARRLLLDAAAAELRQAREALGRGASPMRGWAELQLAVCAYQEGDFAVAVGALAPLERAAAAAGHLALAGQAAWVAGLAEGARGRLTEARVLYEEALSHFARAGEQGNQAAVHSLLAEVLVLLGDSRAWTHLRLSLEAAGHLDDPVRREALYEEAAAESERAGEAAAARRFGEEAISIAARSGLAWRRTNSLLQANPVLLRLGRMDEAAADLAVARRELERLPVDDSLRQRLEGELLLAEGKLLRARDPTAAAERLGGAADYCLRSGRPLRLPAIYLERARAWLALEDTARAEADLGLALSGIERQRQAVAGGPDRVSFLDTAQEAFDEMVLLQARRGDAERALAYAERSRARALLDSLGGQRATAAERERAAAVEVEVLRRSLPADVALLEYAALDDRLLVWRVRRDGVVMRELPLPRADLARQVEGFVAALGAASPAVGESPARAAGARLGATLLGDLLAGLPAGTRLRIVPDGPLARLPFPALVAPGSGRYLVEDHALGLVPSGSFYARARRRPVPPAGTGALVVGDPDFDPRAFPDLRRLPWAAREAAGVAALYPGSVLLTGADADRARFLGLLGGRALVHFAGHTLVSGEHPDSSMLLLAPTVPGGDRGAVYGHELAALDLARNRLVVLSSCAGAAGRLSESEGVLSLARLLLAAGAQGVVAALWEADDEVTAALFLEFHRSLRAGADPLAALRAAQLAQISAGEDRGASWAAFAVFGSPSDEPGLSSEEG
jgi:CHAT domain-containing protein